MTLKLRSLRLGDLLTLYAVTAVFAAPVAAAADAQITLSPGVSIWINARESGPVQRAAQDLARDFRNVLGHASPLTHDRAPLRGKTFIEILGPDAEAAARRDGEAAIAGREAHGVFVKRDQSGSGRRSRPCRSAPS